MKNLTVLFDKRMRIDTIRPRPVIGCASDFQIERKMKHVENQRKYGVDE
jgi:hypothetical protein